VVEKTISGRQANLYGFLFVIPIMLIDGIPYILIWCEKGLGWQDGLLSVIIQNQAIIQQAIDAKWWLLLLFLPGVVVHELIHGVVMAAFAPNGWKSVSFGFNLKAFAPYAHCKEPLTPNAYRLSLMMPSFILGDILVLVSWFTGNILFLSFGILFYWAAAGDVILLWLSRNITDGMLQDHPEKIGFVHIQEFSIK